jgi:cytochrome c oxidase cbb3-type subunit 4
MDYEALRTLTGTASLVFFVLLFAAVMAWTFWPGSKKRLEDHGRIPLNED